MAEECAVLPKEVQTRVLSHRQSPQNTHTHAHRGMERHGEGHAQSDAHKDKERGREEEGGRG